ncbi:MAG: chemotaxis protein CheD [Deltaproteobacteria bacterium]|nr:chemotaxis protein CheD [Deltaproteobacteria bacterium]
MKETIVQPMKCVFATEGRLLVEKVGAGVGIVFFHNQSKTAAGIHVLRTLPDGTEVSNPMYYAETVIPYALDEFKERGITASFSIAVAGGASLMGMSKMGDMGSKLVAAVKETLAKANLNVKLEETGGPKIRSILLDIDAGKIKVGE